MWPVFDTLFWSVFWPGLLSTLIGVVVGLPIGLFVARQAQRMQEGSARRGERERMVAALKTIRQAIEANRPQLVTLAGLTSGHVVTAPALNAVAWDAVKLDVVSYLRDPMLQGALADYFVDIDDVRRLNDRYLDMTMGVTSALSSAATNRETVRTHLVARAQKVVAITDSLYPQLDDATKQRQSKRTS